VLAVLRHLNYRPWFALGEFVDNAVQSFTKHRAALEKIEGKGLKLRVDIDIDTASPARLSIRDNAAGIFESEYARAFRPAALPPDRTGLAEFGMGMKSAACWFAPQWTVRTKALGENVSRTIHFDIDNIIDDDIEELKIREKTEKANAHYTEVILEDIFHVPVGRTVAKLKEHLTDIYRGFIRDGLLETRFNGEPLVYREPKVFKAPHYKEKSGADRVWRKTIEFDFGEGLSVHGFAALRETASVAKAGFSLFRRGRVIQGSGDEGYRPAYVFGNPNSYRYQRLFGELHLEGFEVSHTKDGNGAPRGLAHLPGSPVRQGTPHFYNSPAAGERGHSPPGHMACVVFKVSTGVTESSAGDLTVRFDLTSPIRYHKCHKVSCRGR